MTESAFHLDPAWPWTGREDVRDFCALLDGDGEPGSTARLVGGAVRDALLGVSASDIDIATTHLPQQVQAIAKKADIKTIPTGIDHGTVTAVLESGPVEVTTLRRDVSTDGRRATVAFSDDWREDASRRDFTFNALYAEAETGKLHDYFGGMGDLKAGRLRFIGDARSRIKEDHLRILRLFRFYARFGGQQIDAELLDLCREMGPTLKSLSRERISSELLRLLMANNPLPAMQAMLQADIWQHILLEMHDTALRLFARLLDRTEQYQLAAETMTRLGALLPLERDTLDRVAARLRLSNADRERLRQLAKLGDSDFSMPYVLGYRFGSEVVIQAALLLASDRDCSETITALRNWEAPKFPVAGRDLLALGIASGPEVGKVLRSLEEEWISEGFPVITEPEDFIRSRLSGYTQR
ncbi:MAG: CCA tRNA nucleotidyltransferase [Pseudomonadota bacterium]